MSAECPRPPPPSVSVDPLFSPVLALPNVFFSQVPFSAKTFREDENDGQKTSVWTEISVLLSQQAGHLQTASLRQQLRFLPEAGQPSAVAASHSLSRSRGDVAPPDKNQTPSKTSSSSSLSLSASDTPQTTSAVGSSPTRGVLCSEASAPSFSGCFSAAAESLTSEETDSSTSSEDERQTAEGAEKRRSNVGRKLSPPHGGAPIGGEEPRNGKASLLISSPEAFKQFLSLLQNLKRSVLGAPPNGASTRFLSNIPAHFNRLPFHVTRVFFSSALPAMCQSILLVLPSLAQRANTTARGGGEEKACLGAGSLLGILRAGVSHRVSLNELECFALLSAGFLCLYPSTADLQQLPPSLYQLRRAIQKHITPGLNFDGFYPNRCRPDQIAKLECFLRYFTSQAKLLLPSIRLPVALQRQAEASLSETPPLRYLHFDRLCCTLRVRTGPPDRERNAENVAAAVAAAERQMTPLAIPLEWWRLRTSSVLRRECVCIFSGSERIENSPFLQADFANKSLGGGVLEIGCVQEEILFATQPELAVSRLFFEDLLPLDVARISGSVPFTRYSGYAQQFVCAGEVTPSQRPSLPSVVVCLDAENYQGASRTKQFHPRHLLRELNKLYAALSAGEGGLRPEAAGPLPFATGNWGCGAFGGDCQLKFLLQWMVAAVCERELHYYTFNHRALVDLQKFIDAVGGAGVNVGIALGWLIQGYSSKALYTEPVFGYMVRKITENTGT